MRPAKGKPDSTWSGEEIAAFYHLCKEDPVGNNHLVAGLLERGKGEWPVRHVQTLANAKVAWFGYVGTDGKIDLERARAPPRRSSSFWKLIGRTPVIQKGESRQKRREDSSRGRVRYTDEEKIRACEKFFKTCDSNEIAQGLGMRDATVLYRWLKDPRWNPRLTQPLQQLPPPPTAAPEAVAEPTSNGAPITQVTIDDGHDIKITIPIHEHASTVIAKLMELSKQ